jgi:hypothetical protein
VDVCEDRRCFDGLSHAIIEGNESQTPHEVLQWCHVGAVSRL